MISSCRSVPVSYALLRKIDYCTFSISGLSWTHGAHQVAKTSRIIGCSHSVISTSSSAPVTSRAAAAKAVPSLLLLPQPLLARFSLLVCKPLRRSKLRQLGRKDDDDLAPVGTCDFCQMDDELESTCIFIASHRQSVAAINCVLHLALNGALPVL